MLFWDRGYEGTTFDDLIGAMKVSPSSFYHEFGSKEQLYREAVDYYLKLPQRRLCVALPVIGTPALLSRRSSKKQPHSSPMAHLPPVV